MKTLKQGLIILAVATTLLACKKDKEKVNDDSVKLELQKKQVQNIIPQQYLDSLKKLGMTINPGTEPVKIEGYFSIKPLILKATNVANDFAIGTKFTDAKIRLSEQDDNFSIKFITKGLLNTVDTGLVTAISGSGKDFTVYGKMRSRKNGKDAEFAMIFSGTFENETIKNYKYALICTSNKAVASDNTFLKEGQGRFLFESDFVSDKITEKDFLATAITENLFVKSLSSGFLKP